MYVRMLVTILVSLYTTRIVLETLGVTDFGIYNVIGGFVAMFSFLTTTMSNASTRFFSYEIGNSNFESQRKTFQVTFTIYILLIGVVILIGETIGLWFVSNKLNIPPDRHVAAQVVYQFSLLALIFNIIRIPYNAAIIAHERMKFYAYMSIIEAVLKLAIVYLLLIIVWNKLILYSILFCGVTLLVTFVYYLFAVHKFNECSARLSFEKDRFKEILSFSGWNLTSNLGDVLMDQGLNVVLNLFFGPVVNAARGIAYNVKSVVSSFVGNFQTAASPQITKHYAAQEISQMTTLVIQTSKMSFFLMLIIVAPMFFCMKLLLKLWLTTVPEYTRIFAIIILIESLVLSMGGTLNLAIQASGKIGRYVTTLSVVKFISFALAFLGFKFFGFPPEYALWICVLNSFACMLIKFFYCEKIVDHSLSQLIKLILHKEIITLVVSGVILYALSYMVYDADNLYRVILMSGISFIITTFISFQLGLNNEERTKVIAMIKSKFSK